MQVNKERVIPMEVIVAIIAGISLALSVVALVQVNRLEERSEFRCECKK